MTPDNLANVQRTLKIPREFDVGYMDILSIFIKAY